MVKIALVGAGGYASYLRRLLRDFVPVDRFTVTGLADPFCSDIDEPLLANAAFFPTAETMLDAVEADLVLIASPIPAHRAQCLTALAHGATVLCEKPLVPTLPQLDELEDAARAAGRQLGVGFQWSFCRPMLALKRDILRGDLGAPDAMRALVSFPRYDDYYVTSSWKGRLTDADGMTVRDSVATNGCAHYLHNLFFLLGDRLDRAAMPTMTVASIGRAKPIESFDTCFLRGRFGSGATFSYTATHSAQEERQPVVRYEFGDAVVTYGGEQGALRAVFRDGSVRDYGDPQSDAANADKLLAALDAAEFGAPFACVPETVRPHLAVCSALFERLTVAELPREREASRGGWFTPGLADIGRRCFETGLLPDELGVDWAGAGHTLTFAD